MQEIDEVWYALCSVGAVALFCLRASCSSCIRMMIVYVNVIVAVGREW
jgi:hypothetical protein